VKNPNPRSKLNSMFCTSKQDLELGAILWFQQEFLCTSKQRNWKWRSFSFHLRFGTFSSIHFRAKIPTSKQILGVNPRCMPPQPSAPIHNKSSPYHRCSRLPQRRGAGRHAIEPWRHGDGRHAKGLFCGKKSNPAYFVLNFQERVIFLFFTSYITKNKKIW
jgi:hypothetical protein